MHRWQVELYFDDVKTSLHMHAFRCKSPQMVTPNLVRHLMMSDRPLSDLHARDTLSFKGTMDRMDQWERVIWSPPNRKQAKQRCEALLQGIANDEGTPRPRCSEPRVWKDRQSKYTFMTKPRYLYNLENNLAHAS